MNKSKILENIFLSGLKVNGYDPIIRKVILLNILLLMSSLMLLFFSIYNLFYNDAYYLGLIDTLAFVGSAYAFFDLRRQKGIIQASIIATITAFSLMIALVYFANGKNFTLIWTVFLPIFAIFINGSKKGLIVTAIFYFIIFSLTYAGIGEWQDGTWNLASFLRLVAASIGLTFITYFFERSFELTYLELEKNKEVESRYIKKLEYASITDPLTQLYNRRYLDVQFDLKFNQAREKNSYFAMFILDLDYFKNYNDEYGHHAGDEVLQSVADVLKKVMKREKDSTFRLGGEEFCGLIISHEKEKIIGTVENIRKSIKSLQLEHSESEYKIITASFGVCIINSFENQDLDQMYKIADNALYRAKEEGRNCIRGQDIISTI